MPTVPLLEERATLRESQVRVRLVDTADAHGAAVGRALERFGAATTEVANEFYERDAQRDVDEGDAEYQRRSREIMLGRVKDATDPDDDGRVGFLSMEGNDATANRARIEEELTTLRDEIASRRRSRGAQEVFERVATQRLDQHLTEADRHVLTQSRILEDQAREALAQEHANSAVSNYLDEVAAAVDINAGIDIVLEQADKDGASMERTEAMVRAYQSSTWAALIIRRADQDPDGAARLFENRRGLMNAEDAARVQEATQGVFLADRARRNVETFLQQTGGDYTAALTLANDIDNTLERDETRARLMQEGQAVNSAYALTADDAERRAREAIHRAGFGAVSAADRSTLQVTGRWNALIAEFEARAGGSGGAAERRSVENQRHILMDLANQDGRSFNIVVDAMRGIRAPGVTDEMIREASGGLSMDELQGVRIRMATVDAQQWNFVFERQQEMRGERTVGASNNTVIDRQFDRLRDYANPIAARNGVNVESPSLMQRLTGRGMREQQQRSGEWRTFLRSEADAWVRANPGSEMQPADMDAIVQRGLLRGRGVITPSNNRAFEATPERSIVIPYRRIPENDRRALAQEWARRNPNVTLAPNTRESRQAEEWVERAYAAQLQAQ